MSTESISARLPLACNGSGLASGRSDDSALATVLDFLLPGMTFGQAVEEAVRQGAVDRSAVNDQALNEQFEQLPPGQQRQLGERSEQLPPSLRETTERRGLAQHTSGAGNTILNTQGSAQPGRADVAPHAGELQADRLAGAIAGGGRAEATVPEARLGEVRTAGVGGGLQRSTLEHPAWAIQGTEHAHELQQRQDLIGRAGEAVLGSLREASVDHASPDRPQTSQPAALPGHAVLSPQGRTDALASQPSTPLTAGSLAAGASPQMAAGAPLAQPQGTVTAMPIASPRTGANGVCAPRSQERLNPAGHTGATEQRQGGRRRASAPGAARPADGSPSLLAALRRRNPEEAEETTSTHWLYWLLTSAAYGALGVALIAMVPSGAALTDGFGRPTFGAYALILGAAAALGSWWLARRLSRR